MTLPGMRPLSGRVKQHGRDPVQKMSLCGAELPNALFQIRLAGPRSLEDQTAGGDIQGPPLGRKPINGVHMGAMT